MLRERMFPGAMMGLDALGGPDSKRMEETSQ